MYTIAWLQVFTTSTNHTLHAQVHLVICGNSVKCGYVAIRYTMWLKGFLRIVYWVIPCQINKEFRVTSRILTKLGVFVVPVVLITHANF